MKTNKFFELAKEKGIRDCELKSFTSRSTSFSIFHSEIDSFSINESSGFKGRGIYNGRFGAASCDKDDKDTASFLVSNIIENAKIIENNDPAIIFKGSSKYSKKNLFNKEIELLPIEQKLNTLFEIEKLLKEADERVVEVEGVSYSEEISSNTLENSFGLKLKQKSSYYVYSAAVVVKEKEEIRTGYKVFLSMKLEDFDIKIFVHDVITDAISKLGGTQCKSKKYPTILCPKVTSSLLNFYIDSAVAEDIQKHSSLFEGKLNTQIASKRLTVSELPLTKNCFFRYFDDEGVATYNKKIIEKGVLKTYLYNLETAKKDNVTTTANGYGSKGGKTSTSCVNLCIKPGKKNETEIMAKIKEGIYISSVEGLHAGMNTRSGNFSLQASGFMIRNGVICEPLSLITIAGNLMDVFRNVQEVANNNELQLSSTNCPSIRIKSLMVSGQ